MGLRWTARRRIFAALGALLALSGCASDPADDGVGYAHQPARGLPTPGDSVSLARGALQRLRNAAVVGAASSEVLEAMAANPQDYPCPAGAPEARLCDDFLAEPAYAPALVRLLDALPTFAADAAVGLSFVNDASRVKHFLWLPPDGAPNGALLTWEPRPEVLESPLPYRLVGTDSQVAASLVGFLSARIAEQMFLARAANGVPNATTARAMGLLLARYAMLVSAAP